MIGEAAFKLPPELLHQHPGIPWKKIIGTRHILVHDYFEANRELLWDVVRKHLEPLRREVETMLQELA